MRRVTPKRMMLALVTCLFAFLSGMVPKANASEVSSYLVSESGMFAWVTYWDAESMLDEMETLGKALTGTSAFSTLFDDADMLYLPEEVIAYTDELREHYGNKMPVYLTVVNDVVHPDGSSTLKDTEVLKRLFASDESMDKHISQILDLAEEGGYDGIEIDYEAIKSDSQLWQLYVDFLKRMYARAEERGLGIRVILEPAAIGKAVFPQGPEYVMMYYNLFGYHSGPGPKADLSFIKELAAKCKQLPGGAVIALATGGFDWAYDGAIKGLTEKEAEALLEETNAKATRDENSQCLVFTYQDEDKLRHEVWYADGVTLKFWMYIGMGTGEKRFALWRLGGNEDTSLERIACP